MNVFIYGDESGVFDKDHNDVFVYGGLIFLGRDQREIQYRKFIAAERKLAPYYGFESKDFELKACRIKNKHKAGLFRSTNGCIRYAIVINQQAVNDNIFSNKKSKKRYLDYVYKVGLKKAFGKLIQSGKIDKNDIDNIYIRFDEHTTATDGRYELKEAIEAEFKYGTINYKYNMFHKPIFPDMKGQVELTFKDSKNDALIRASDIIANQAWHCAINNEYQQLAGKLLLFLFP